MKKKPTGKKSRTNAIIAAIVIMAIIPAGIYYYNQQKFSQDHTTQWTQTSGPFSINNSTYRLGDNVFMVVFGLKSTDVGKIIVYDPKGGIFSQIPFNGTEKSEFNYFFKPNTERPEKLCTPQDLIGNWTIVFQETSYRSIPFQVINQWVQGSQSEIKPINPC